MQNNVEVSRGSSVPASITLFRIADPGAILNAWRNCDFNGTLAHYARFAFTLQTRICDDTPHSLARWARPGDRKKALLVPDLSPASAGVAYGRSFSGCSAASFACIADLVAPDLDARLFAGCCLFECEIEISSRIASTLRTGAPASAPADIHAEEIAENIAKDVAEILEV
jgi:hypothetical protein